MSQYVEERKNFLLAHGIDPAIAIEGLEGRCTDRMSEGHLASEELLIISHPGWNRFYLETLLPKRDRNGGKLFERLSDARKTQIQHDVWAEKGMDDLIQEELLIKELIASASAEKMPIVLTVPSHHFTDHKNLLECIRGADNINGTYLSYLRHLIGRNKNIYLFPTYHTQGNVIGDEYGNGNLLRSAAEAVKDLIRFDIEGKRKLWLDPEGKSADDLLVANVDVEAIARDQLDYKSMQRIVSLGGEGFVNEVKERFGIALTIAIQGWANSLDDNNPGAALLKDVLFNGWKKIYFAGGQITKCLAGTMSYFIFAPNMELEILGLYTTPSQRSGNREFWMLDYEQRTPGITHVNRNFRDPLPSENLREGVMKEMKFAKENMSFLSRYVR
ncbi:MAG TPA: hypothetical protein VJB12_05235, partial [Candidatus Nanoarchaeia archaeon]|nr:hypothetical protein [Candidatus Nanoarchaeia archaeon]